LGCVGWAPRAKESFGETERRDYSLDRVDLTADHFYFNRLVVGSGWASRSGWVSR